MKIKKTFVEKPCEQQYMLLRLEKCLREENLSDKDWGAKRVYSGTRPCRGSKVYPQISF